MKDLILIRLNILQRVLKICMTIQHKLVNEYDWQVRFYQLFLFSVFVELDEFLGDLEEDVEGMQSMIYALQQQLKET